MSEYVLKFDVPVYVKVWIEDDASDTDDDYVMAVNVYDEADSVFDWAAVESDDRTDTVDLTDESNTTRQRIEAALDTDWPAWEFGF